MQQNFGAETLVFIEEAGDKCILLSQSMCSLSLGSHYSSDGGFSKPTIWQEKHILLTLKCAPLTNLNSSSGYTKALHSRAGQYINFVTKD